MILFFLLFQERNGLTRLNVGMIINWCSIRRDPKTRKVKTCQESHREGLHAFAVCAQPTQQPGAEQDYSLFLRLLL